MSILSLIGSRAGLALFALAIIAGLWWRLDAVEAQRDEALLRAAIAQTAAAAMRDLMAGDASIQETHDVLSESIPAEGSDLDPVLRDLLERLRDASEPKGGAE